MAIPVWVWWAAGALAADRAAASGALGRDAQALVEQIHAAILHGPGTGAAVSAIASRAGQLGVQPSDVEAAMARTGKPAGQVTLADIGSVRYLGPPVPAP